MMTDTNITASSTRTFPKRPKDGSKTKVLTMLGDPRFTTWMTHSKLEKIYSSDWLQDKGVTWRRDHRMVLPMPSMNCEWDAVRYRINNCSGREIDTYHAIAHVLTPGEVALHGIEFIMNLVEVTSKFKLLNPAKPGKNFTAAETKRLMKTILKKHNIKSFTRATRTQTTDELVADLLKLHEELNRETP